MQNVEIKTPIESVDEIESYLGPLGAEKIWIREQTDTFFNVQQGWLKMREVEGAPAEMIAYMRSVEDSGPRPSTYDIAILEDPVQWKRMMDRVLGTRLVVEKTRVLWIWKQTRIHLDSVKNLGTFLELEAVAREITLDEAREQADFMIENLHLDASKFVSVPYAELLAKKEPQPETGLAAP